VNRAGVNGYNGLPGSEAEIPFFAVPLRAKTDHVPVSKAIWSGFCHDWFKFILPGIKLIFKPLGFYPGAFFLIQVLAVTSGASKGA
jgi:hypothetical protein